MSGTVSLEEFNAGFHEEPGYLDFARFGPLSDAVLQEHRVQSELLSTARFGSIDLVFDQDERVRSAAAQLLGLPTDQVAFQPNTSMGLMHAMFGMTGVVAMSPAEFPSITYAASRAADALGRLSVRWLQPDGGRVTPGTLRDQLDDDVTAVAVSLVDFRTGYVADLEGIRQVIGDRLLLVDAIQGFTVVDAPWQLADVIVSGGQKWVRAGHGTGMLALSERAADQLVPVLSGWMADDSIMPLDEVRDAPAGAAAFRISHPSSRAQAGFAAALESVASVGVDAISQAIADRVDEVIALADEFGVAVVSPRERAERAGIVVLDAGEENATVLAAALFNHGVTVTTRGGVARLSVHSSTDDDTVSLLRTALTSYRTAAN
jgi:selenocysteine lyase/cysteine desulfurase